MSHYTDCLVRSFSFFKWEKCYFKVDNILLFSGSKSLSVLSCIYHCGEVKRIIYLIVQIKNCQHITLEKRVTLSKSESRCFNTLPNQDLVYAGSHTFKNHLLGYFLLTVFKYGFIVIDIRKFD